MGSNSYKMQIMLPLWMALGLNLPGCDSDVQYETKRNTTPLTQTEETGSIIERIIYPEYYTSDGLSFEITTPTFTNSQTPTISWKPLPKTDHYLVMIAPTPGCEEPTETSDKIRALSYTPTTAISAGTSYICIDAYNGSGEKTVTARNSGVGITLDQTAPAAFAITSPVSEVSSTTPVVSWQKNDDVVRADVFIDDILNQSGNCEAPFVQAYLDVTTSSMTLAALGEGDYFICVTAYDAAGNSTTASNNGYEFEVDLPSNTSSGGGSSSGGGGTTVVTSDTVDRSFTITAPGTATSDTTPTLVWSESQGADDYDIKIASDIDCKNVAQYHPGHDSRTITLNALTENTYYVCVYSNVEDQSISADNNGRTLVVDTTSPDSFNITSPATNTRYAPVNVAWGSANGASLYQVDIDTNNDCSAPFLESHSNISSQSKLLTLNAQGTYYACVTATDDAGNSQMATNNGYEFTVDTVAPGNFAITGPAAMVSDATPTITWSAAQGASSYQVIIDDQGSCASPAQQQTVTDLSYTATSLSDGDHFICITAVDMAGNTNAVSNNSYKITIDTTAPGDFAISAPNQNTTIAGIASWGASTNAVSYEVIIDDENTCSSPHVAAATTTALTYAYGGLTHQQNYHLCVTAIDAYGNTTMASNGPYAFTVATGMTAFNLTSPTAQVDISTPVVSWQKHSDANTTDIFIDTTAVCAAPFVQAYTGLTGSSITLAAMGEGTYYICATAYDLAGNAVNATNTGYQFEVDLPANTSSSSGNSGGGSSSGGGNSTTTVNLGDSSFAITDPVSSNTADDTPTITWAESGDATRYDVTIASDIDCNTAVQTHDDHTSRTVTLTTLSEGSYYVCVVAENNDGLSKSASNNGKLLVIDTTAPDAFNINGPAADTRYAPVNVTWESANGASVYRVDIDTNNDCVAPFIESHTNISSQNKLLSLTAQGSYFTCVTAIDAAGNETAATNNNYSFALDTAAPGAFSIQQPSAKTNDTTPTISWSTAAGATSYQLIIDNEATCSAPYDDQQNLTTNSYTPTSTLNEGDHYICVSATDDAGNTIAATNSNYQFTINQSGPDAFNITNPGTSAMAAGAVIWEEAANADRYLVIVDDEDTCSEPYIATTTTTNLSFSYGGLSDNTTYYTCVTALDDFGNSQVATNSPYGFNVDDQAPGAFSITDAPSGSDRTPTITWNASDTAARYRVIIDTESPCVLPYTSATDNISTTSHTTSTLSDGDYYVCIEAYDSAGNMVTATNNAMAMTINNDAPDDFSITNTGVNFNTSTPTMSWNTASGANSYQVIIDDENTCASPHVQEHSNLTATTKALDSMSDGTYYLCVSGLNGNNSTASSSNPVTVIIDTQAPDRPDAPTDAGTDTDNGTLTFNWTAPQDNGPTAIASYDLRVGTTPYGSDLFSDNVGDVLTKDITVTSNAVVYAHVRATDVAGNVGPWSMVSDGIEVYLAALPALDNFVATAIAGEDGFHIEIAMTYPSDTSLYQSVDIRRKNGTTAPTDCSDGDLLATITSFNENTFYDAKIAISSAYSYRACIHGKYSLTTSTNISENILTANTMPDGHHLIFTTSSSYQAGTVSGISGANSKCNALKPAAYSDLTFRALIADSYNNNSPASGITITAKVKNTNGDVVANDSSDLWDGSLAAPVNYDENGNNVGSVYVWTNLTSSGSYYQTNYNYVCMNWATNTSSSSYYGRVGYSSATSSSWLAYTSNYCYTSARLYCMSETASTVEIKDQIIKNLEASAADQDGEVSINLRLDQYIATDQVTTITLVKAVGTSYPSCALTGTVKSWTASEFDNVLTHTDQTGVQQDYSYRACAYGPTGDLLQTVNGLHPQDTVFVTSTTYDGNLGGLDGADSKCQERAQAGGHGGNWIAMLSTDLVDLKDRIKLTGKIRNTAGQIIADNEAALFDGGIDNTINTDEFGNSPSNYTWTNTTSNGSYNTATNNCDDWTNNSSSTVSVGYSADSGAGWLENTTAACSNSYHLYCIRHTPNVDITDNFTMAAPPQGNDGDVAVTIDFSSNSNATDADKVVIRRKAGVSGPASSCDDAIDNNNAIAKTLFAPFADQTFTDATGIKGGFTYRLCVYDSSDNLIGTKLANSTIAKGAYIIFASSGSYQGNAFSSRSTANDICTTNAQNANLSGSWYAVMSFENDHTRQNFKPITPVYNTQLQKVADHMMDFYNGSLDNTVSYNESGTATSNYVWTGSSSNSGYYDSSYGCLNWTTSSSSYSSYLGYPSSSSWLAYTTTTCNNSYPLFCTNVPNTDPVSITVSPGSTNASVDMTIALSDNFDLDNISSITLRRTEASTSPNDTCSDGDSITVNNPDSSHNISLTDDTGAGGAYYYRLCIYNNSTELVYASEPVYGLSKGTALVFVASSEYSFFGGIGSLANADQQCNEAAANSTATFPASGWKALMSTSSVNAKDRFNFAGTIYNTNGQKVADSKADLFDGSVTNPIYYDENGTQYSSNVWTGSTSAGSFAGAACQDYTSSSTADTGSYGSSSASDSTWLGQSSTEACNIKHSVYCVYEAE